MSPWRKACESGNSDRKTWLKEAFIDSSDGSTTPCRRLLVRLLTGRGLLAARHRQFRQLRTHVRSSTPQHSCLALTPHPVT